MYKPDGSNSGITFSIASPELGIEKRSYLAVEERVISITLDGEFTLTETNQARGGGYCLQTMVKPCLQWP